ncbi:MAG TPA: metallophosphoesterase family protein [bacterium]|nr:metallophosphoesterase family protein [bacterium]HPR87935.1 metallophosphoesterase family protein [bacterium]
MSTRFTCLLAALLAFAPLRAQESAPAAALRFHDGHFKIVQFTDLHFQANSYRSDSALVLMGKMLEIEKPDLIIITGDVVTGANRRSGWETVARFLAAAQIPWAVVLGNHDPEGELSPAEIVAAISGRPGCLTVNGPDTLDRHGNYVLEIRSSRTEAPAALLYGLDSGTGRPKGSALGEYEWVHFSQIAWYRAQSRLYTAANGGTPLPALAFLHIPVPEYKEVIGLKTTVGLQREKVCSPDINTGLYAALLESGDVMGLFAGHDHSNNYIGCLHGICLAYGYVSGRQCYGDIGRGARVIVLHEGKRQFDTWVRKLYECNRDKDVWVPAADTTRQFVVTYPDSFDMTKPYHADH